MKIKEIELFNSLTNTKNKKDIVKKVIEQVKLGCLEEGIPSTNITGFLNNKQDLSSLEVRELMILYKSAYKATNKGLFNTEAKKLQSAITKIADKGFIGQKVSSIDERTSVLLEYNLKLISKLLFLNARYTNINTKTTNYSLYARHIYPIEQLLKKDLMHFTEKELQKIMLDNPTNLISTKRNINSFVNGYLKYCKEKKYINTNKTISYTSTPVIETGLQSKVIGLSDFYEMLEKMEQETRLPNLIPLLLARYGIVGDNLKEMINLKWEDIDKKKLQVSIYNQKANTVVELPVDKRFIEYIEKAKLYTGDTDNDKNSIQYEDNGYVLKKAYHKGNSSCPTIGKSSVFSRINIACSSIGIPRIGFKALAFSRQFDILAELRRHGRLTQKDFQYVAYTFSYGNPDLSVTKAHYLKEKWQELIGDIGVTQRKSSQTPTKKSNQSIYNDIVNTYGLHL